MLSVASVTGDQSSCVRPFQRAGLTCSLPWCVTEDFEKTVEEALGIKGDELVVDGTGRSHE